MAGRYRGPLHGIPIGLKDIYETKGIPTTGHSKVMRDHVPAADAFTVRAAQGCRRHCPGKLATHEFAFGGPSFDLPWPPARNPWDTRRFTGGSSSGTGAAVPAGLVLGGTGSDTGGSIRGPAAYCGLAGIKPSYGLSAAPASCRSPSRSTTPGRWHGPPRIADHAAGDGGTTRRSGERQPADP